MKPAPEYAKGWATLIQESPFVNESNETITKCFEDNIKQIQLDAYQQACKDCTDQVEAFRKAYDDTPPVHFVLFRVLTSLQDKSASKTLENI